ncbi:MAG: hypothetical protein ACQCN3_02465 [Candidatus Bathyarchaeia archaeon]|jgi:hypothetical protein
MSLDGVNPQILQGSIAKQFRDCMKGSDNGIPGLLAVLDALLDVVPKISPLRIKYKNDLTWFISALTRCSKERMSGHVRDRERAIFDFMGFRCPKCGKNFSLMVARELGRVCSTCKCDLVSVYREGLIKLLREYRVDPSPEAVLMCEAYERRAEAFCLLFEAVREVALWAGVYLDESTAYYYEQIFLGLVPGEGKISIEQKQAMQILAQGNFSYDAQGNFVIGLDEAKTLFRKGFEVTKWGYLSNSLQTTGTEELYNTATEEYGKLYSEFNAKVRKANFEAKKEVSKHKVDIIELPEGKKQYYPYVVLPEDYWQNGKLPKQYKLIPETEPDFYPKVDAISFNEFFGPPGSGKTTGMAATLSDAVANHNEFAVNILSDKSNAFTLASLPMFGYDGRTNKFVERLTQMTGFKPKTGIPVLTITVALAGEEIPYADSLNPPTIWDRKVIVDNYRAFTFDWNWAIEEYKKIATSDFYNCVKPKGVSNKDWIPKGILVNVRNLQRINTVTKENFDIQVAISLLPQWDAFRKSNPSVTARLLCDELGALAPATSTSPDTYDSGNLLKEDIKDTRRNTTTIDGGTQQISDVITEVRNNARNLFWRNLQKTGDKSRSQEDIVFSQLQVEDDSVFPVLRELNDKGRLRAGYFWCMLNYDKVPRKVQIIQFSPPFFMINDPFKTNYEIFRLFEKSELAEGRKVLLKSWDDVPSVKMGSLKVGSNIKKKGSIFKV